MDGVMYFLRHGETIANEQNYLSGVIDVPLSDLGRVQAKEAGAIILKKALRFDEVHTSNLARTKATALIALRQAEQQNIPFIEAPEIAERDFGIFAGLNKNLLKKSSGYRAYEKKLHSPLEFPESGETFEEMYERVHKYYFEVLLPRTKSGKSILVVCHKYIIEMFALIFSGIKVEDYFDFRLPNAKPMSEKELVGYVRAESKLFKEFSDRVTYHAPCIMIAAAILGIMVKTAIGLPLNSLAFLIITSVLLGISTFFVALGLNTNCIRKSFKLKKSFLVPWYFKFALAGGLFLLFKDHIMSSLIILLLMPPALTAPAFSLLWGGSLYLAIEITFLISFLAALCIVGLLFFSDISFYTSLLPFLTILVFSMLVPAYIAQSIRIRKPVESGKFTEHWKWLGVFSIILFSFFSTYRFTPTNLFALLLPESGDSTLFLTQGLTVFSVFMLIKAFAYSASKSTNKKAPYATDIYITHSTPNIFLWITCISLQADVLYIAFWACIVFFLGILMDEIFFVNKFRKVIAKIKGVPLVKPALVATGHRHGIEPCP